MLSVVGKAWPRPAFRMRSSTAAQTSTMRAPGTHNVLPCCNASAATEPARVQSRSDSGELTARLPDSKASLLFLVHGVLKDVADGEAGAPRAGLLRVDAGHDGSAFRLLKERDAELLL